MVVMSFLPTACVYYKEDVFLEESVANVNIFRNVVYREGCVGSRHRRELAKLNESINIEPFVVAVKRAIYIAPKASVDANVPWLLCLIIIISMVCYSIVKKLMYRSDWVLFISDKHPEEPQPKESIQK